MGEFISFRASSDIAAGEEMCIEYSQASNLEFMIRYGFKVEFLLISAFLPVKTRTSGALETVTEPIN